MKAPGYTIQIFNKDSQMHIKFHQTTALPRRRTAKFNMWSIFHTLNYLVTSYHCPFITPYIFPYATSHSHICHIINFPCPSPTIKWQKMRFTILKATNIEVEKSLGHRAHIKFVIITWWKTCVQEDFQHQKTRNARFNTSYLPLAVLKWGEKDSIIAIYRKLMDYLMQLKQGISAPNASNLAYLQDLLVFTQWL